MKNIQPNEISYSPIQIITFFALTLVITWSFFVPAINFVPDERQILFIILGAFGPLIAAVIVILASKGKAELGNWLRQIFRFRIAVGLYMVGAFVLPIGVGVLQFLLYNLLGGEADFSEAIPWYLYLLYLMPTALLSGGNEEPGWRGFALPALLGWFHPIPASLILGLAHSLWHLPLMDQYNTTFGWYLFNLIPLTFVFNWLYLRSRRSILPVMFFHAGTNVIGEFIPTPMNVFPGLGSWMIMRGLVYWGMAIVVLIWTKGCLGKEI